MTASTPTRLEKLVLLLTIVIPLSAVPVGIIQLWGWGVDWPSFALFLGFFALTGFGVTVGFHRLFTHSSFEAVRPLKILLAIAGSMAIEGPLITWVARHNKHHRHADQDDDPHSPLHGFWHAHLGFFFKEKKADQKKYAKRIRDDADLVLISRLFPLWAALSLLLPTVLGYAISKTATGALLGFLWGGLIRVCVIHHLTWSINSVCHVWGKRRFKTNDKSRNNVLFGLLGFGEGWHNNHHAFPTSALHGLGVWWLDISYLLILALKLLGLVRNVRVPNAESIRKKEVAPQ